MKMIKKTKFLDEKQRKIPRKAYENISLYSLLCTRPINRNVTCGENICLSEIVSGTNSFLHFLLFFLCVQTAGAHVNVINQYGTRFKLGRDGKEFMKR